MRIQTGRNSRATEGNIPNIHGTYTRGIEPQPLDCRREGGGSRGFHRGGNLLTSNISGELVRQTLVPRWWSTQPKCPASGGGAIKAAFVKWT